LGAAVTIRVDQGELEQAAASKRLCLAAGRSHWLVDGWGALLGELCSPLVLPLRPDSQPHFSPLFRSRPGSSRCCNLCSL